MASLEELAAAVRTCQTKSKVEAEEVYEDDDLQLQDLLDALGLLSKSRNMLNYLADPDLTKTLTKHERKSMDRLSKQIKAFLDAVEHIYIEDESEEKEP